VPLPPAAVAVVRPQVSCPGAGVVPLGCSLVVNEIGRAATAVVVAATAAAVVEAENRPCAGW